MRLVSEDRRSDAIYARDLAKSEYDKQVKVYNTQEISYLKAQEEQEDFLEDQVKTLTGRTFLDLVISANFWGGRFGALSYGVKVAMNESGLFADKRALTWSWSVSLNEQGEVEKESSSWSGLSAVTLEQMDELEESVRVLRILNNIDWKTILSKMEETRPKRSDYITMKEPYYSSFEYDKNIKLATIEDAVGSNILIKGDPIKFDKGWHGKNKSYYMIISKTPKQVSVLEYPVDSFERVQEQEGLAPLDIMKQKAWDYRVTIDKFLNAIPTDVEIIDLR